MRLSFYTALALFGVASAVNIEPQFATEEITAQIDNMADVDSMITSEMHGMHGSSSSRMGSSSGLHGSSSGHNSGRQNGQAAMMRQQQQNNSTAADLILERKKVKDTHVPRR